MSKRKRNLVPLCIALTLCAVVLVVRPIEAEAEACGVLKGRDQTAYDCCISRAKAISSLERGNENCRELEEAQEKCSEAELSSDVTEMRSLRSAMGCPSAPPASEFTLKTTKLWYGSLLRSRFPRTIPFKTRKYPISTLPCLSKDITKFRVDATQNSGLLKVAGDISLSSIRAPFKALDGKSYMLEISAYLFSPEGKLVWKQHGAPKGSAYVSANGASIQFVLLSSYAGRIAGYELILVATGTPVLSSFQEMTVVVGAKRVKL